MPTPERRPTKLSSQHIASAKAGGFATIVAVVLLILIVIVALVLADHLRNSTKPSNKSANSSSSQAKQKGCSSHCDNYSGETAMFQDGSTIFDIYGDLVTVNNDVLSPELGGIKQVKTDCDELLGNYQVLASGPVIADGSQEQSVKQILAQLTLVKQDCASIEQSSTPANTQKVASDFEQYADQAKTIGNTLAPVNN